MRAGLEHVTYGSRGGPVEPPLLAFQQLPLESYIPDPSCKLCFRSKGSGYGCGFPAIWADALGALGSIPLGGKKADNGAYVVSKLLGPYSLHQANPASSSTNRRIQDGGIRI